MDYKEKKYYLNIQENSGFLEQITNYAFSSNIKSYYWAEQDLLKCFMISLVEINFIQREFLKLQFRNITTNVDMKKMSKQLDVIMLMYFIHKRHTGTWKLFIHSWDLLAGYYGSDTLLGAKNMSGINQ